MAAAVSAKKYVLNAIQSRLNTDCLGADNLPIIKTFGVYNAQFENERKERPIYYPAVLARFASLQYKDQGTNIQTVDATITLYIAQTTIDDLTIDFLDVLDQVNYSLHGFQDDHNTGYFSALYRVAERQQVNRTNVIVWEIDYKTYLRDSSTDKRRRLTRTNLTDFDVTGDNNKPFTLPQ